MYIRNWVYLFAVVCCTTFVLNYTVVRNMENGGLKKSTEPVNLKLLSEETLWSLRYRRSRPSEEPEHYSNISSLNGTLVEIPDPFNQSSSSNNNDTPSSCLKDDRPSFSEYRSGRVKHSTYTIIRNYAVASTAFGCNESVTYTTHGEFRFLDNLVPLTERWEGPVSIALYAPGSDFEETAKRIFYLRECTSPLIKKLVTFHIFYDSKFAKDTIIPTASTLKTMVNCDVIPSFNDETPSFRRKKKLTYPVNVARNLARREATTLFVLPSDIELYPSLNIIPNFLEMIAREDALFRLKAKAIGEQARNPRVYVLPVFEVELGFGIPDAKKDLTKLLKTKTAVPFHKYVCPECHKVPKYNKWLLLPPDESMLNIFHVAKRRKPYHFWEPIYIGTNQEPYYDERLTWEGLRDKMSQGFALCTLDYDFMILDNAFLVHRPGMKKKKRNTKPTLAIRRQNRLLANKVIYDIVHTYGRRRGCFL